MKGYNKEKYWELNIVRRFSTNARSAQPSLPIVSQHHRRQRSYILVLTSLQTTVNLSDLLCA
uniref:Uncharacterized protein n=1 Tax=Physcomitrium patens TaxID=3218 RepID=A0A2K1JM05_PHYPA|nr:hypothetical protein PHYPA_017389 [Physcomitrium patens]